MIKALTAEQNGNLVAQVSDPSYTGGSPGVWLYYGANQIANWSGGDVASGGSGGSGSGGGGSGGGGSGGGGSGGGGGGGGGGASFSVGGTVSGSSGLVVLQDNGGDDLSVAADGSFAFDSPVASGSAYVVTVKADPPGQSCTVADGSGTMGSAGVTGVAVTCVTNPSGSGSDDFSRADGPLGSNWTTVQGTNAPVIAGNTVQPGTPGSLNSAYWSADTFGSDQYAQANLPNSSGGNFGPGIAVRLANSTGYLLWYRK